MNWFKRIAMPLPNAEGTPPKTLKSTPFVNDPPNPRFNKGLYTIDKNLSQENADKINTEHPNMEYVGHGLYGVAYENPTGNIIKITSDSSEAQAAQILMKKPCLCAVKVFSIQELHTPPPQSPKSYAESKGTKTWKITMEKLEPLSGKEREWVKYLSDFVMNTGDLPEPKEIVTFLTDDGYYDKHLETGFSVHRLPTSILYEFLPYHQKYEAMIKCMRENNFMPNDAHEGNIGKRQNGSFAIFDLGGML